MSLVSAGVDCPSQVMIRLAAGRLRRAECFLLNRVASVGDYVALMKPRVMSLVVFTALVGLVVAPVPCASADRIYRAAVHRGRRRRRRRAQHVVRRRHRRRDDAHRAPRPIPTGRVRPGEALAFGITLAVVFGGGARTVGQLRSPRRCSPSRSSSTSSIYTMWLKRSTPQNIVIGGAAGAFPPMIGWAAATGALVARTGAAVPHHLLLDAAAFLGAGAVPFRGLCPRRHSDAAGCRRRRGDAAADFALHACSRAARRRALAARLRRRGLWRHCAGRRRGMLVLALQVLGGAPPGRSRQQAIVRLLDPLSLRAFCRAAGRGAAGRDLGRIA